MANSLIKGQIGKEDLEIDITGSTTETFSRISSTGGTLSLTKFPDLWTGHGKIDLAEITVDTLNYKLDDLDTPDDNTDLNVSTSYHGLCPKDPNDATKVLRSGGWGYDKIVQFKNYERGDRVTGTTLMVLDNTVPQVTEGDEYLTLAFQAKATLNYLLFDVVINLASSANSTLVVSLHRDLTADAIGVAACECTANKLYTIPMRVYRQAGGVTNVTYTVRAGAIDANTTTLNGYGGNQMFGGVMYSSLSIWEIAE